MTRKPFIPFPTSWEEIDLSHFEQEDEAEQLDLFGEKVPCNPSAEDA